VLSVSSDQLGIQTGMNQTFRNLGSAVGPVLAATVTATYTTQVLVTRPPIPAVFKTVPSINGFVVLFLITASVGLLGFLLTLGLRNYRFGADGSRLEAPSAVGRPAVTGGPEPSSAEPGS
jgi:hypothetical protein